MQASGAGIKRINGLFVRKVHGAPHHLSRSAKASCYGFIILALYACEG